MTRLRLTGILPKGLYWRTLLIIAAPAAVLQIIITFIFLNDHWEATTKRMSQAVAADVALLIQLYERDPTAERLDFIRQIGQAPLRLAVTYEPTGRLETTRCRAYGSAVDRFLTESLASELGRPVWYDSTCPGRQVEIRAPVANGVMSIKAFRDRVQARSGPLFVVWITGATLFFCIVSILFIRNQVRPIEKLAAAMERFGRGEDVDLMKPRGAREVRQATEAFFDMRRRIQRHIDQRAQLLAGVSHDLRTPLTRLKLQFALMPASEDLEDARRDLKEMETTLDEYLMFARGQWAGSPEIADIGALAAEAAAAVARGGGAVTFEGDADLEAPVRAAAVRRALANLIDNAAAHGETVHVTARRSPSAITVCVEDDGPGIAEDLYEDAFRPFSRLDETRTKNTKGVGLGLAIARDVARSHGGDVTLGRSALGGLCATLRLPVKA
jgi:two-component system osmolarity sensor histidine kinase EnvZ